MTSSESQDVQARLAGLSDAQRSLLERRLLEQRAASAASTRISRRDVLSPVPLSYSQELLWLLSQLEGGGVAYNAPAAFRLHGPVDASVLQQALDGLVSRHEILRTRYDLVDDQPMQIIEPSGSVELREVDLSDVPESERDSELERFLHNESEHEFDLRVDLPLRPFLIRMGPDDHIFFNVMHHVATDGWSRAVLHQDLTELYDAALERREPKLSPLRIQYADYAVWHRSWLDGGVLDQQLDHWRERCAARRRGSSCRPTSLGRLSEGTMAITPAACSRRDLRQRLEEIARESGATLFMVLLAAYATLLHRYSGDDDIVIGTPFAGRNRSELEGDDRLLHQSARPAHRPVGGTVLQRVGGAGEETTLAAFAHADVPYEMVVRATTPGERPEPVARLPGDDGAAQPGVGAQAPEVRAQRRDGDGGRTREGMGEVRPPARHEPTPRRPQHDLGVQQRAVRRRRRPSGLVATSRSSSSRSPPIRQVPSRGFRCFSTRSAR